MSKRHKTNKLRAPFLYWLPRALARVDDLMPYGERYDFYFEPMPGVKMSVTDSDIRGFRATKRQLEECVGKDDSDREAVMDLIIAMVRLESHCKHLKLHKKEKEN